MPTQITVAYFSSQLRPLITLQKNQITIPHLSPLNTLHQNQVTNPPISCSPIKKLGWSH